MSVSTFSELMHSVPRSVRSGEIEFRLHLPLLNLCVALWLIAFVNGPFWRALWRALGGWHASYAAYLLSLPLFVLLWVWLLLECLTWGRAAKPILAIVLALSAGASYFMNAYAIVIDRDMLANIVETDTAEAIGLLSPRLLRWLAVFGIVPIWLLSRVRVYRQSWPLHLLIKATTFAILLICLALVIAPFFQSYALLLRNHHELVRKLVPSNYIAAAHGYVRARLATHKRLETVALDATRSASRPSAKPTLTILMIGETARASNFMLNGYGRLTTPELAADTELINFGQVRSCGTSTAVSLPCMFLDVGRAKFTAGLASRRENLLDVLQRAGFAVLWRDNNSGCKAICDRVELDDVSHLHVQPICENDECYDEILLNGLHEKLDGYKRDVVVVLHMKGSHGPAYYKRYPPSFEFFTPVCKTIEFDRCESASIVNAYDNTLRYTDYVIARAIELLRRNAEGFDASLIYVSDHGESLGEHGFYLHGLPYGIAPEEQIRIPMLMWISPSTQLRFHIDIGCLRRKGAESLSHDNFYHSILGLLGVQTSIYRPQRDLFHNCRGANVLAAK